MKIAQITYANTEPFFRFWDSSKFELLPGNPKSSAEAAKRGDVVAGPLPLVECWKLENDFVPLGAWGIAVRERCRSVFVLSHAPFAELDHIMMGVSRESATSVVLCETLIRQKYGNDVRLRKGLQMTDPAWLVIGDQALQIANSPAAKTWSYSTDLATEWWHWKKQPFVFAQWVVRKDMDAGNRAELSDLIKTNLTKSLASLPEISKDVALKMKLPPAFMNSYLSEFMYELDNEALESALLFRELVQEGGVRDAHAPVAR